MPAQYEIRIAGALDTQTAEALGGWDVVSDGEVTVVTGEFDQAGLHGVLERIRQTGLDLVDMRRVRGSGR